MQAGRTLPTSLRSRLMRDNGGEIEVDGYPSDDATWSLHPVWDRSDSGRTARTANHIERGRRVSRRAGG
jgi:hypothetical protein